MALEGHDLGDAPRVGRQKTALPVDRARECEVRTPCEGIGDAPRAAGGAAPSRSDQGFGDPCAMLDGDRDDSPPPMADAVDPPPREPFGLQHLGALEVADLDRTEPGLGEPAGGIDLE